MTNVAALPALALLVGAAAGVYAPLPLAAFVACAAIGWLTLSAALIAPAASARSRKLFGRMASRRRAEPLLGAAGDVSDGAGAGWSAHLGSVAAIVGFFGAGAALAAGATREALTPPILAHSHAMRVDVAGAAGAVPVVLSGVIRTDASRTEFGAMFTLAADAIRLDGVERATAGTVRITVGGTSAARHVDEWRAGRHVRVTATLAAPLPYLNIGTPNQETRLALAGTRLFGSVKSAAQVELLARGRWWDEAAASVRAYVRRVVAEHVRGPTQRDDAAAEARVERIEMSRAGLPPFASASRAIAPGNDQAQASGTGAAIATAILIGDRAGLDQDVEERLQRAGTFHVIAISGGNIAILTALILGLLRLFGTPPRASAWLTISAVGVYAFVVGSGASVARAALAAIVYLFARAIDHRTPPINVLAVVVAIMLVWAPLEVVDAGFWLTCLATLAIMLLAQRLADRAGVVLRRLAVLVAPAADVTSSSLSPAASGLNANRGIAAPDTLRYRSGGSGPRRAGMRGWLMTSFAESAIGLLAATVAAEAVLLPVTAYAFSQVSIAGLVLNFFAIPLMTVVQIAGMAIVFCGHGLAPIADIAGVVVDVAARGIVSSSHIVDAAPWSAPRVAPPPLWLLLACQASLCVAWFGRPPPWRRRIAACAWLTCLALVVLALPLPSFALHAVGSDECQMTDSDAGSDRNRDVGDSDDASLERRAGHEAGAERGSPTRRVRASARRLRVTFLDVAQGDATLIRFPDGRAWLVDAGGALGRFDIGTRIVSPALWALGLRRLSTLVLTHGDRDHIGGAHAMLRDFRPDEVWEGVPVEGHGETTRLRNEAARRHMRWRIVQVGERVGRRAIRADDEDRDRDDGNHGDHGDHGDGRDEDVDRVRGVEREVDADEVDIRVWHPSAPRWMRTRVRNDDSIVLELAFGNVSLILPGDIGPAVERVLAGQHASPATAFPAPPFLAQRFPAQPSPASAPAHVTAVKAAMRARLPPERLPVPVPVPAVPKVPLRVLKVPHHGSRTSSTAAFLDALQPRLAIVSAGRGNRHGHPAPAALARYAARGTEVFRTDRDGAIQLDTDGHTMTVRTCSGRRLSLTAGGSHASSLLARSHD